MTRRQSEGAKRRSASLRLRVPVSSPSRRGADLIEQAALRYLANRDRTEAQVRGFLSRAGASAPRAKDVIARFFRLGYLNDAVYAQRWAGVRLARRPMGRDRLEAELLAQGLDRATVAKTLDKVYSKQNERDLARSLLSRRIGSGTRRTDAARAGLLRRYGFREEVIEELLNGSQ